MGGRGRGNKRGRTQRRDFRDGRPNEWKRSRPDSSAPAAGAPANSEGGWIPFLMESTSFEHFYKKQRIVPEEEWDAFIMTLRKPLPTTFRINGSGQFAHEIRDQMQRDFFDQLKNGAEVDGDVIEPVRALPWYPDNLAWHLGFSRMQIRKLPILERIHEFLKLENEIGSITRQEAVSMIPPLFLDVRPHHKVLDMCAAPGSKTFQLLEMIHRGVNSGELSDGMVIANDSDVQRCHLLIHQTKRMCSPNIMVTNHDAQLFPGLKDKSGYDGTTTSENSVPVPADSKDDGNGLLFDRILCDVPCSGDGTLRKAPDIWRKWNCGIANGLHKLQVQIAMRGVALLKTGGRLVYSTCSLNPVEDEAVVGEILRESGGSVELLDVSSELPELKRRQGLTSWKIRDRKQWLCSASQIDRRRAGAVVPSMFPSGNAWDSSDVAASTSPVPGTFISCSRGVLIMDGSKTDLDEEAEEKMGAEDERKDDEGPPEVSMLPLERSMRILPHDQDTGGFFIAVFQKVAPYKAVPKLTQHKPRVFHRRSDKETVIADGESDAILPASITLKRSDLETPKVDDLVLESVAMIAPEGNIGHSEPKGDTEDPSRGLSETAEERVSALENGEELSLVSIAPLEDEETLGEATPLNTTALPDGRTQRQGRWKGVDPVLFLNDEKIINSLIDFYGIKDTFPLHRHLVTRSEDSTRLKRIYYLSGSVSNAIQLNFRAGEQLKITSAGLKIFERQQPKDGTSPCSFRIASEGLPFLLPHMSKQIVLAPKKDFRLLLADKVVPFSAFNGSSFSAALQNLKHGCCVVALPTEGPDAATNIGATDTAVACWRGRTNLSVLITKAEANQMHQRLSFNEDMASTMGLKPSEQQAVQVAGDVELAEGTAEESINMEDVERHVGSERVEADVEVMEYGNGQAQAGANQSTTGSPSEVVGEPFKGKDKESMETDLGNVEVPPA